MPRLSKAMLALALGVVLAPAGTASAADQQVTIVGAGPGAGAFQLAGAMAEAVNRTKAGIVMTNRASPGFVANTRMVETRAADFALTNGIFVYDAQNGREQFKEMRAKNIQGIGPVTTSWFQMAVRRDSGIKSYEDLKGKRVNYAQKGSNTEYMTRLIFEWLGIHDSIRKEYMRWDQAATAMTDGNIDAFGIPNPVPSPSILQAATSTPVRILSLPDAITSRFIEMNPGYYKETIKPGSYAGMENEPFTTIAYTIFAVANGKVDADVVYKVTKATYGPQNREFLINAFRSWRIGLDQARDNRFLEQMQGFGLKLHPGAERYWKEVGLLK
ncbi:MAG TPA: TAXI family TRAP transporter solute-binding subunit [Methylomirabilota bacterium]|nr:TAXI family TRAP transporter solute-binding subunit [Methylomirabilota bacterium]